MSNASAAYTQILAITAVDSYLTVGSTESFFVGSNNKYSNFAMTHVVSNQQAMTANAQNITIERDGDYLAGIAVFIKGPGLKAVDAGTTPLVLAPGASTPSDATSLHLAGEQSNWRNSS